MRSPFLKGVMGMTFIQIIESTQKPSQFYTDKNSISSIQRHPMDPKARQKTNKSAQNRNLGRCRLLILIETIYC